MTSRREDHLLRGLSFEEFLRRSITNSPPVETALDRQQSRYTQSPSVEDRLQSSLVLTPSPSASPETPSPFGCPANSGVWRPATSLAGPPPLDVSQTPIPKYPSRLYTQQFIFGQSSQPHAEFNAGVKPTQFFDFTFNCDMVREQQSARNPLAPSMANSLPPPPSPQQKDKDKDKEKSALEARRPPYADLKNPAPSQPEFGKPTTLGASPQPFAKAQPLVRPGTGANVSAPRQPSGSQKDKYSNLFVSSKNKTPAQRPELHKPHAVANPLQAFRNIKTNDNQPPKPASSRSAVQDDDLFEIPKPANFPSWQPKPFVPPSFSSSTSTNPFFKTQDVVDLTGEGGSAVPDSRFDREEPYSSSDPYIYMDSAKANENIKALLEGAFEDEDDKPKTRSRKKELDTKLDELADKMKSMTVEGSGATDAADAEEEDEEDDGTVVGLKVKLLPHQIEGVNWMRDKETGTKKTRGVLPKGGILADDMGLGKTIQSIALILTNPKPSAEELEKSKRKLADGVGKGTLVVAPLALIKQWEGEIKDRVEKDHALKVCVHHGPQRAKSYKELQKYDVVITTYQTLSSEHAGSEGSLKVGCFGVHWYRIILDEAHSIKNRNAKATKAACALNAEYRWCLTGTPMQNNLDELQSLIHFLRIKPYDDLNLWREQITKPWNNGKAGLALRRLQVYLKAFMKRRTKDVLKQQGPSKDGKAGPGGKSPGFKIVARTVEKVEAEFTEPEREFYKRLESRTDKSLEMMMAGNKMSYASALVLLMRLRQACNHPKLTGSDLSKENDALSGSQTPSRRKASVEDDMDSIANMLGGLSVETKLCDVCQIELSPKDASEGAIRCPECEADLQEQKERFQEKKKAKREKRIKQERKAVQAQRKAARRIVEDSDDEENENNDEDEPADDSSVSGDDAPDDDEDDYSSDESGSEEPTVMQSTKIRHLISLLKADSHQHKYIVFSFFTSMLDLIEPFLKEHRIRFTRYDGKMRNDAREASLNSLRTDPSTRVLLCSLRAGSLGLNLTAASRVVILEPFWNPFVEEQAIDRVHRLNQTQDVKVYKLTIKDTVEERILELQDKKRELANATIEGKKGAMKLTLQDMLKLFGRDAEREHPVETNQPAIGPGPTRGRAGLLDSRTGRTNSPSTGTGLSSTTSWVAGGSRGSSTIGNNSAASAGDSRRERMRLSGDNKNKNPRKEHEIYGRRW
ncbi:putative ATP-dependent helicase [Exophiala dermatitidis]